MSNLLQRIITGVLGGALVVGLIFASQWGLALIVVVLSLVGLWEFYQLSTRDNIKPNKFLGLFMAILLLFLILFSDQIDIKPPFWWLVAPLLSLTFISELFQKSLKPFESISLTVLGLLYVVLPFIGLYLCSISLGTYQPDIPMGILACLWASDSGAYFAGKSFGKHKLFERISPKKTWEGSVGGLLLSLITAFVWSCFFKSMPLQVWLMISFSIVVMGSLGDLVESMFKRSLEIKDSGSIIPGHGGVLDRFDGLFMAIPWVLVIIKFYISYTNLFFD